MTKISKLILTTLFLSAAFALHAAPVFELQELFPGTSSDQPNYRIPGIITAPNGDILAFAEKRNDGIGDIGNTDIAMRRSEDNGKTWLPIQVIVDDKNRTCADITLCVDQEKGRIFLFFLANKKRFVYTYSDDNGKTWNPPVDIHRQVTLPEWDLYKIDPKNLDHDTGGTPGKRWERNWHQRYGIGPGNAGIQLRQGPHKGRLIIPSRHRDDKGSVTHVFYSDDHGKTWRLGKTLKVIRNGNENQLTELADGSIMMNARGAFGGNNPDATRRFVAISKDGGDTWTEVFRDESLVSLACHAAILTYYYKDSPHNGLVLFSNPNSAYREEKHPYGRYNMTVRWSTDNGVHWSAGRPVYPFNASYSDMTVLNDGSIGMIFERGDPGTRKYWHSLYFARFNLEWLMAPPRAPWFPVEGR